MIDSHCHIHSADFPLSSSAVYDEAMSAGIEKIFVVGTSVSDSELACKFAVKHGNAVAIVGHHPHEASSFDAKNKLRLRHLIEKYKANICGIGECGLDYWYGFSNKQDQKKALIFQLDLGIEYNLPFSFHIRGSKENPQDAFDDFWSIFDKYDATRGVVHSFSANSVILQQILDRKLLVGINGIMTFSKQADQLQALEKIPLESIAFETDAPYLTPKPYRGKVNTPIHVVEVAKFVSATNRWSLQDLDIASTRNVREVFLNNK